jgi:DNA-binding NarL/FixJ family response regulator
VIRSTPAGNPPPMLPPDEQARVSDGVLVSMTALLIGRPGYLLEGLAGVLRAYPREMKLYILNDGEKVIQFVQRYHPDLIVFDFRFPLAETYDVLGVARQISPNSQILAFAEQAELLTLALAGADAVLLGDARVERIYSTIEHLLHLKDDIH